MSEEQVRQYRADIDEYLKKVKDASEHALPDFKSKVDANISNIITDAMILLTGTHPLEWDVEINNKYELEGRLVLVPVMVPKSILISMDLKGIVLPDTNVDQDIKDLTSYVFLRGIAAVQEDGKELIPKHIAKSLEKMLRDKMQREDDEN